MGLGPQEIIDRDAIEGVHFKRATSQEIIQWEKDEKTLFVRNEMDTNGKSQVGMGFS